MAKYINADALLFDLSTSFFPQSMDYTRAIDIAKRFIKEAPTVDAVEVKHGYWIDKPTGRYMHYGSWCSVCGNKSGIGGIESNRHKPYCPNCGAKMDVLKGVS